MKTRSKGITLSYIYFILNTMLNIIISAYIVRNVGKVDYGVYQAMTAFISYLVLLEFGTGTIMSRNLSLCKKDGSEDEKIKKNISTIWGFTVVMAIVISIVSILFYFMIDGIYANSMTDKQITLGKQIFLVAVITMISAFLNQTLFGLLIGFENYVFEKTLLIVKLITRSILILFLLNSSNSIFNVVIIDCVLSIVAFISTIIFVIYKIKVKLGFKYFEKNILISVAPLAFAMLLQTVVNTANGSLDKFLISIMMTPQDVAVYSVGLSIFSMFSTVTTIPVTMFMPSIANNMQKGIRGKELTKTLVQACRLNVLVSGTVAFGFLCVGKQFIEIIYGSDFSEAWILSIILIFPMFVNMSNAVVINVIDVLKKRHVRSMILMVTTLFNIVTTIIAIKYVGMIGAALATGISLIAQTILLNIYYRKKIGIDILYLFKESYKGILLNFIVGCVAGVILVCKLHNIYMQFVVGGLIFVIVSALLFIKFGANNYEKEIIKKYKK